MDDSSVPSVHDKSRALIRVARFRPAASLVLVALSLATAALEGVGLGFILPIVTTIQASGVSSADGGFLLDLFVSAYGLVGLPLTLASLIGGVVVVMGVRFIASFLVRWLSAWLAIDYHRELQTSVYDTALDARIAFFDAEGSDAVLNGIVTQAGHASGTLRGLVSFVEELLLVGVYLTIAVYLAPRLTIGTIVLLGGAVLLIRTQVESGYEIGDRVAEANERVQRYAQAGVQGIHAVKLFGLADSFRAEFDAAVDRAATNDLTGVRNEAAITNGYRFLAATAVFALIYLALTVAELSLAAIGLYLFTMFRLVPRVSSLSSLVYRLDRGLPHLVRTHKLLDDLATQTESQTATRELSTPIRTVTFDDVTFSYDTTEDALRGISFSVERGEFAAFVGPSGAGKSTIAALLARLYEPSTGRITADGTPIDAVPLVEWRNRIAVVRQRPYIFDETLRWNVTVGNRDATRAAFDRACEIAQVTEFVDDLPDGYATELGDDGVRLSGGQRQRVAIARALLKDADVLVLDEATSDLDATLEARIHAPLRAASDMICLVIAHRFSTVTDADEIYVLEDGRIVARGDHGTLLDEDDTYTDLYEAQMEPR